MVIRSAVGKIVPWKVRVLVAQSCRLFVTPRTVTCQAPLSMEFSRQEYRRRIPSPGDLPNPGMEPMFPSLQADFFTIWVTKKALHTVNIQPKLAGLLLPMLSFFFFNLCFLNIHLLWMLYHEITCQAVMAAVRSIAVYSIRHAIGLDKDISICF